MSTTKVPSPHEVPKDLDHDTTKRTPGDRPKPSPQPPSRPFPAQK